MVKAKLIWVSDVHNVFSSELKKKPKISNGLDFIEAGFLVCAPLSVGCNVMFGIA